VRADVVARLEVPLHPRHAHELDRSVSLARVGVQLGSERVGRRGVAAAVGRVKVWDARCHVEQVADCDLRHLVSPQVRHRLELLRRVLRRHVAQDGIYEGRHP